MPWAWAIPAAASLIGGLVGKKKQPNPEDYFGDDLALQKELRGYVSQLMPGAMKDNSARYEAELNRLTADQFNAARAGWDESAARRGIRGSSFDFDEDAQGRFAGAEADAMAGNFSRSQAMARGEQGDRLGFISQLLGASQGLGRGKELAYGAAVDDYNQGEAGRMGLLSQLGGITAGTLGAELGGMNWKQALASGLSPEYYKYLLGKSSAQNYRS